MKIKLAISIIIFFFALSCIEENEKNKIGVIVENITIDLYDDNFHPSTTSEIRFDVMFINYNEDKVILFLPDKIEDIYKKKGLTIKGYRNKNYEEYNLRMSFPPSPLEIAPKDSILIELSRIHIDSYKSLNNLVKEWTPFFKSCKIIFKSETENDLAKNSINYFRAVCSENYNLTLKLNGEVISPSDSIKINQCQEIPIPPEKELFE